MFKGRETNTMKEGFNYKVMTLSLVIVLAVVIVSFVNILAQQEKDIVNIQNTTDCDNKAEVLAVINSWGDTYSNEVEFDSWIYNFGDVEAQNISVKCVIQDEGIPIKSVTKQFGNLASHSYKLNVMFLSYISPENSTANCYIVSCGGNCEILSDKIPAIKESIEGTNL